MLVKLLVLPKAAVPIALDIDGATHSVEVAIVDGFRAAPPTEVQFAPLPPGPRTTVSLIRLAFGRSGDKGNHSNIGIIAREPRLVHYHLSDGRIKLAAAWLIDACGWRGKSVGNAAVYDKQALVIINKGGRDSPCTGGEVVTLAKAIQTSVYERFGIQLEPEPVVV